MVYRIEKSHGDRWSREGLGESEGWPSVPEAVAAVRSLGGLVHEDEGWAGVYRVVDETTGDEVHVETVEVQS